jgi:hypothetical protein
METTAFIGKDAEGRYAAHVEYDEPGPFRFLQGPRGADVADAVEWSRRQTPRVLVRIDDRHYSAGTRPIPGTRPWYGEASPSPAAPPPKAKTCWRVEARTSWSRPDRDAVARRLAAAVADHSAAGRVDARTRANGYAVMFHVFASSELDAHAAASAVLRHAWASLDVLAVAGEDYDVSSISVHSA